MKVPTLVRSVAACLCGYLVIALLNVLTLELILGGVGWTRSSGLELAAAGFFALVAGLAGGSVAAFLGKHRPLAHALSVLVLLLLDTIYIIVKGLSEDPIWFDLAASGALMAATVGGGWLVARRRS